MANSKRKGKRGELEAAKLLNAHGIEARRGVQYAGSQESPDIVTSATQFHFEVKYAKRLALYEALDQAKKDAGYDQMPCVLHRQVDAKKKLNRSWVVILDAEDFLELIKRRNEDANQI